MTTETPVAVSRVGIVAATVAEEANNLMAAVDLLDRH